MIICNAAKQTMIKDLMKCLKKERDQEEINYYKERIKELQEQIKNNPNN